MTFLNGINEDLKTGIVILIIVLGAFITSRLIRWLIDKFIKASSEHLKIDSTQFKFLKNAVSFIVWITAVILIIYSIPDLKTIAVGLFAGAGILAIVIGFAGQHAFANIISGIFIIMFKPFRVGDIVRIGDNFFGIIEDITLRHTVILNFENKRIIIPNSVISNETLINESIDDAKVCRWVEIGISYDSDVDKAIKIIQEEAVKHPNCLDNRTKEEFENDVPQVVVRLISFGDFSINLRAYVWTKNTKEGFILHTEINRSIKKRFDKEGIEIPFPYRTIVYKKDLNENSQKES
jgi:small conductance mechanosensitive channel